MPRPQVPLRRPSPPRHHPWLSVMGPEAGDVVRITPQDGGWRYAGLQVLRLEPGDIRTIATGDSEVFVLPLAGGLTIEVSAAESPSVLELRHGLIGRASVFERVTDFAYVGRDSLIRMMSVDGAEVALPSARCERRLPPAYGPAWDVPVEVHGAGPATRQVTNFGVPGVWDHAERLIACETLTPDGNWSSYPPHKHDPTDGCPVADEEIYYFRISGSDGLTPERKGFALHRAYTGPEHDALGLAAIDDVVEVRDGDVYCVPHGYHGPSVAAPGYAMYHLNVLAGPGPERSLASCDDPAHDWVHGPWAGMPRDPRCPVTTADGRTDGRRLSVPDPS